MKTPPKFLEWILTGCLRYENQEAILGDFEEQYLAIVQTKGRPAGYVWYIFQIIISLPKFIKNNFIWSMIMLRNYLKIALRNLKRYKGYSFLNIAGLTVGMTGFIILMLFVKYELSYDTFFENADNIFRVQRLFPDEDAQTRQKVANASVITYGPLGSALKSEFPEVIHAVRIEHRDEYTIAFKHNNDQFIERGFFVDDSFFDIFSYNLMRGDINTALTDPFSLVITEKLAQKYFGGEDPLGKTIIIIDRNEYAAEITGIIKEIPGNSHLQFDFLLSMSSLNIRYGSDNFGTTWSGSDFTTYIEIRDDADSRELEGKLSQIVDKYQSGSNVKYALMPVSDIHLKSQVTFEISKNSEMRYVYFFFLIAFVLLIIACLNFINLATAFASKRAKEIGVRKAVGAVRIQLVKQFLFESFIICSISLILAVVLTAVILPDFNLFTEREIAFSLWGEDSLLPGLILLTGIIGFLSGLYPALYVSAYRPVAVLKGLSNRLTGKTGLRNTLVVFQFIISIILITGTLIIGKQLYFIRNTDVGYNREQVLVTPISSTNIRNNIEALKTELLKDPSILSVATCTHIPSRITWGGSFQSKDDERVLIRNAAVDFDFVDLFEIEILEGRSFSKEMMSDRKGAFLLNQTAVNTLGWESPLGRECDHRGKKGMVVGIIKDFHFQPLYDSIEPLYLFLDPGVVREIFVKISPGDIQSSINFIGETVEAFDPSYPFSYYFLDDSFNNTYRDDQKFGTVFTWFSLLAIFIACLGLFGLISYTTEMRSKEIGIRKILGADSLTVIRLLSRDFIRSILLANIVALPAAYLLMNKWLQNFAYTADVGIELFLFSALIVLILPAITVCSKTIRAARANPARSIQYE
ncbi:ABC transporter permease [candidate division KSB1 bacterium]